METASRFSPTARLSQMSGLLLTACQLQDSRCYTELAKFSNCLGDDPMHFGLSPLPELIKSTKNAKLAKIEPQAF